MTQGQGWGEQEDRITELEAELAALKESVRWRSVENELPEEYEMILAYFGKDCVSGEPDIRFYSYGPMDEPKFPPHVKLWRPMPKGPT
jgi:hypothetical protein